MNQLKKNNVPGPMGRIDNWCRNRVVNRMGDIHRGHLVLSDGKGLQRFGDPESELTASLQIVNPRAYRQMVAGGSIGFAEAYISGFWNTCHLTDLLRIFVRSMPAVKRMDRMGSLKRLSYKLQHLLKRNTRSGSRRNIHDHYDLGNDFFSLFLDETKNYSCVLFRDEHDSLEQAATNKMAQICKKLDLKSSDHLIEIGTGWGGVAVFAASNFGCRVTTTTISEEQFDHSRRLVKQLGLEDQVTVLFEDYRNLKGKFDKLVSVEMIEAVGHQYFDTYFQKCSELLKDDGRMVLQAITIGEQHYDGHRYNIDFIKKYIFPGGCLPCVSAISKSIGRTTDMRIGALEDITSHYVTTLQRWRSRFEECLDEVRRQGFSEEFIRMWRYYFCYCEATFAERRAHTIQATLAKPGCPADFTNLSRDSFPIGNSCDAESPLHQRLMA